MAAAVIGGFMSSTFAQAAADLRGLIRECLDHRPSDCPSTFTQAAADTRGLIRECLSRPQALGLPILFTFDFFTKNNSFATNNL